MGERANGTYHRDTGRHRGSQRERNVMEKVDGRERHEVRGIRAKEIIAGVMERVESAEGFGMSQAWDVGNALKYLLRAGRKDALDIEPGKAENCLHRALTGEWLSEEGTHGIETA